MCKKILVFILLFVFVAGCGSKESVADTQEQSSEELITEDSDYGEIKSTFLEAGYRFDVSMKYKNILDANCVNVDLGSDVATDFELMLYVYDSEEDAKTDLNCLHGDGFTYSPNENTTENIDWVGMPHFYQYKNTVLLCLGTDKKVQSLIEKNFGESVVFQ